MTGSLTCSNFLVWCPAHRKWGTPTSWTRVVRVGVHGDIDVDVDVVVDVDVDVGVDVDVDLYVAVYLLIFLLHFMLQFICLLLMFFCG